MSREFPRAYEHIDGAKVHPAWAGRRVPIAPKWVRDRVDIPRRFEYATLAKDVADKYPAEVRERLVDYVKQWDVLRQSGCDLVIAGHALASKRLWAAVAVQIEIVRNYGAMQDVSVSHCGPREFEWMIDARKNSPEGYQLMKNRLLRTKLLLLPWANEVTSHSDAWWLMQAIYTERYERRMPTITILTANLRDDNWTLIEKSVGTRVCEILRHNHHDFLVHY